MARTTTRTPYPFLKWAGGKDRQADLILGLFPEYIGATYHEPFLGAGAVFLAARRSGFSGPAVLSDLNSDLIDCWAEVASNPEQIMEWLDAQPTDEKTYFRIRAMNSTKLDPIVRAARFIYLNRTCFNGLYRLGPDFKDASRLVFNVPWGKNPKAKLYDRDNLEAVARSIVGLKVTFNGCSFRTALESVRRGDLVYFDPPYVPIKKTSFTRYTGSEFGYAEQEELAAEFDRLVDLGARVILSNAKTPWVVDRFRRYEIHTVNAARSIAADGGRRAPVPEVLIVGRVEGENEWQSRSGSSEPEPDSESSDAETKPSRGSRSSSRSRKSSTPTKKHSTSSSRPSNEESGSSDSRSIEKSSEPPSPPSSKSSARKRTGSVKRTDSPPSRDSDAGVVVERTKRSAASSASKSSDATSIIAPTNKALCQIRLLAIDPGESESGWVYLEGGWPRPQVLGFSSTESNAKLRSRFIDGSFVGKDTVIFEAEQGRPTHVVIETMQWRGQPMYWQSIATLIWVGRFQEAWTRIGDELNYHEIVREAVKLYCCGSTARKDQNVRASLEERYGGKSARGNVDFPGPLYGISKHAWQALGLGVTWFAQRVGEADPDGRRV